MATYRQSKSSPNSGKPRPAEGYKYQDRNIAGMSPEKAQESLKPTEAEPVNMHKRMAGCS